MNTVRPGEANKVRHVGAMTAVMRAARFVAAPRALRVGVVEGNRIVSERVLDAGEITVGEDESSSIVIAGAGPRRPTAGAATLSRRQYPGPGRRLPRVCAECQSSQASAPSAWPAPQKRPP